MTMIRRKSSRPVGPEFVLPDPARPDLETFTPEDWRRRLNSFVGVPFKDGGRDVRGSDCWGMVRMFLAELKIDAADYSETPAADLLAVVRDVTAAAASDTWLKVDRNALQMGDVVLLTARTRVDGRPRTMPGHVGVMIDSRRMLHVEESTASVIVPLGHPSVRNRLAGFFRHRDLA